MHLFKPKQVCLCFGCLILIAITRQANNPRPDIQIISEKSHHKCIVLLRLRPFFCCCGDADHIDRFGRTDQISARSDNITHRIKKEIKRTKENNNALNNVSLYVCDCVHIFIVQQYICNIFDIPNRWWWFLGLIDHIKNRFFFSRMQICRFTEWDNSFDSFSVIYTFFFHFWLDFVSIEYLFICRLKEDETQNDARLFIIIFRFLVNYFVWEYTLSRLWPYSGRKK